MVAIAGQHADAESLTALKDYFKQLGSTQLALDGKQLSAPTSTVAAGGAMAKITQFRSNYILNSTLAGAEEADVVLLIGTHPRLEAPILNTRLRKAWMKYSMDLGYIGAPLPVHAPMTFEAEMLGTDPSAISKLASSTSATSFMTKLKTAKRPMVIVGSGVFERGDAVEVLSEVGKLCEKIGPNLVTDSWNGFNVLQKVREEEEEEEDDDDGGVCGEWRFCLLCESQCSMVIHMKI